MAKRGRKAKYDLSRIACPNPNCPDFNKEGVSVVSNGTYLSRNGVGRRFKCKTCGFSFCKRSGSIFLGLRTPEEKIISALKLMAKGMTIRKASEILQVKPDTLRKWLALMVEQYEKTGQILLKEPGVSEAELKALRDSVKQALLRRRANLWRQKTGWWQGWNL